MIFKVVSGVSSPEVGHLWNSPLTLSENVNAALDITAKHPGHYKNRIVLNWTTFNPQEVNLIEGYQTEPGAKRLSLSCSFCFSFLDHEQKCLGFDSETVIAFKAFERCCRCCFLKR